MEEEKKRNAWRTDGKKFEGGEWVVRLRICLVSQIVFTSLALHRLIQFIKQFVGIAGFAKFD